MMGATMLPMTTFSPHTTVRFATESDRGALARLAVLDSTRALTYPVLVGESAGDLVAARSLHDGHEAADPFKPTADVLDLVRVRASQCESARSPRRAWTGWVGRDSGPSLARAW